ncbi:hypothetical protein [Undibacterium aquatile]|uniref:hypothetical protein n=1 Tax=Undibacterium aquatile TaxID=1537398 RepID=UPI001CC26F47|nr:hypothetical protein [Undibacterium aquatile]
MKNIQIIDGADNSVFDIFAAAEEEFSLIFADGHDVAFIDELMASGPESELDDAFNRIWTRRIPHARCNGYPRHSFFRVGS